MTGMLPLLERSLLVLATAGYLVAWIGFLLALRPRLSRIGRLASNLTLAAWVAQAGAFLFRIWRAGHLPVYSGHEFSSAFAGGLIALYLVFERVYRRRDLGCFALPVALALLAHAWSLAREVEPLIPIFRSLWLDVHIVTAFVAYAALAVTFAASCLFLFKARSGRILGPGKSEADPRQADLMAYRAATVGFSFLSICIISGAIWAEQVWGRFWSWDPKETWSLITWLIMAAYLHARYHHGWQGRRAAVLGIAGFVLVLVTYVGVDYLSPRQHAFLLWERL